MHYSQQSDLPTWDRGPSPLTPRAAPLFRHFFGTPHRKTGRRRNQKRPPVVEWTFAVIALLLFYLLYKQVIAARTRVTSPVPAVPQPGVPEQLGVPGAVYPFKHLQNLIIVACHSVFVGNDFSHALSNSSWYLLGYQKLQGQVESFVQHMQLGVMEAAADPTALMVFSGGQSRREAGPRSEGASYWGVSQAAGWWGHPEVRDRTITEEFARDSFENLLFSVCRFREATGHYPRQLVVVSYEFKHERFAGLHLKALRWPPQRARFLGSPAMTPQALEGEARTIAAYRYDPYGCRGYLKEKRLKRDPFALGAMPPDRCPEMAPLMSFCGYEVYAGRTFFPWEPATPAPQGP